MPQPGPTPDGPQDPVRPMDNEIRRIRRLREDVLLLRFYLDRRTDIARQIDPTDRLLSETALKSSFEILQGASNGLDPGSGHVAASASALMQAVGVLIHGARMAAETDAAGEEFFPVTPETLRASLPPEDIHAALGLPPIQGQRQTASQAADYLTRWSRVGLGVFSLTLVLHLVLYRLTRMPRFEPYTDILICASGLYWAMTGSLVWVLLRFGTFGAAYAFDPAHARVFDARVISGSLITAVLLLFVFGGKQSALVGNWQVNLPLWGFVIGCATRLQVELLRVLISRVESAIRTIFPASKEAPAQAGNASGFRPQDKAPGHAPAAPPVLPTLKNPKNGAGPKGNG